MNWVKERIGIQDPIYGPSAIQSVAEQADSVPYTELTKDDLRWVAPNFTCVETQTFYVATKDGHLCLAQVIYNNVGGIRTTYQFNSKVFYANGGDPLWTSDPLSHCSFDEDRLNFQADNCSLTLGEDGTSYTIKSSTNSQNIVDVKFTRDAPGFVAGRNGTTTYGTDPQNPWGSMRHAFWPRCRVEGTFLTQSGPLDVSGLGLFIHALQGMKPNLAAARWNFANFQSPTYSAVMMEFTTPPSYGSTVVNVGGVATSGKLLFAGARHTAAHTEVKGDEEVDWPEPSAARFHWTGKTEDGKEVEAEVAGSLGQRLERVDVMAQVPKFVKAIIASAAGARPFIYQFGPRTEITVKTDGVEQREEGSMFMEATFISGEQ